MVTYSVRRNYWGQVVFAACLAWLGGVGLSLWMYFIYLIFTSDDMPVLWWWMEISGLSLLVPALILKESVNWIAGGRRNPIRKD